MLVVSSAMTATQLSTAFADPPPVYAEPGSLPTATPTSSNTNSPFVLAPGATSVGLSAGLNLLGSAGNRDYWTQSAQVDPLYPVDQPGAPSTAATDGRYAKGTPFSPNNAMVSLELNFRVSQKHFWAKTGLNIGFVTIYGGTFTEPAGTQQFAGCTAPSATNTITCTAQQTHALWLEGMFAPRYYFMTDVIRPYVEAGVRIAGLINTNDFLPNKLKILPGIYAAAGVELMVTKSVAVVGFGRFGRELFFNFPGFFIGEAQAGLVFYL